MTSLFDQHSQHTLSVHGDVIPQRMGLPALVAVSMQGEEGVDSLFDYQIVLKTPSTLAHLISDTCNFDTNSWLGHELSVQIHLAGSGGDKLGAGVREINGIISDVKQLRVQDRHAYYSIQLKPWLHAATMMGDCRIFQDMNVKQVIEAVLGELPYAIQWRLFDTYPARDYTTQFNESTFDFVSRLCQTWGISYFFEHGEGKHRLVFTDYMGGFHPNASEAYQTVLFHGDGGKIDEEYLYHLVSSNKLTPGSISTRDFDYTRPNADLSVQRDDPVDGGRHREHDIYQWHSPDSAQMHYVQPQAGPNQGSNAPLDEGDYLARIRLEQWRCEGVRAHASGHVKGMQPGHHFKLHGHARRNANIDYLILHSTLSITELATESQPAGQPGAHRHQVKVDLELYPLRGAGAYRPPCSTPVPRMFGVESAIVVAPESQDLWIDHLGRIKVQFPWDRLGKKNQNSSCWVRVATPSAGNQLGAVNHPRRGQEVIISFISGNPDLPVCTGRVYNQDNRPPWLLSQNGALSGMRSRELLKDGGNAAGGRSNHLVLDDSVGQIQAQLKSDHQHSQLSLGYITRIEDNQGRKDARGEGFELRTDGHGALRAGNGLLISTALRERAIGHIKDIDESIERLQEARALAEQAAQLAEHHQAQADDCVQSSVNQALLQQNQEITGTGTQGQFSQPHLLLSSPAGIASTTPKNTHLASGEHMQLTSGGHTSISAKQGFLASALQGMRLFAHKLGMKLIAAYGDMDLQAQNGNVRILAQDTVIIKCKRFIVEAEEHIQHQVSGTYQRIDQSQISEGMPGIRKINAAGLAVPGPATLPMPPSATPTSDICIECMKKAAQAGSFLVIYK